MKNFKKQLSFVLVTAMVISTLTLGFGQLKSHAATQATGQMTTYHISMRTKNQDDDNTGTDSNFKLRLVFTDGSSDWYSDVIDDAGDSDDQEWGDTNHMYVTGPCKPLNGVYLYQVNSNGGIWKWDYINVYYNYGGSPSDIQIAGIISSSFDTTGGSINLSYNNVLNIMYLKTLTFDANGGTGGTQICSEYGATLPASNIPIVTRTGYTFAGWSPAVPETGPNVDTTYTAQWTTSDINITFDANGGIGGTSSTMVIGDPFTAPTVTRTGYTFAGWSPTVPSTVPAVNTTYTAQWVANTYTVSFKVDAFSASVSPSSKTVIYGNAYGSLPTPSRTNYRFDGWYTGSNGAGTRILSTTTVTITASQNLYAKWNYSANAISSGEFKYIPTGGGTARIVSTGNLSGQITIPSAIEGYTVTSIGSYYYTYGGIIDYFYYPFENYSSCVILPSTITSIGSDAFAHGGSDIYFTGDAPSMADTPGGTMYYLAGTAGYITPTWLGRPCYPFEGVNITFDANGGTGGNGPTLMVPGLQLNDYIPTVTKTGYYSTGWSPVVPYYVPAVNTTYTAQWTARTFTVTFDPQGGTVTPAASTVTYDSTYGAGTGGFPTPVRTGYTFGGWFTSSNGGGTKIFSTTTAARTTSQTLYAKWTANQYTITFDANGGTGGTSASMTYGTALTVPTVTKPGFIFTGWSQAVPETVGAEDTVFTALWNLLGDIGGDGQISVLDALMALQASSGKFSLTANQLLFADVNHDGKVSPLDALMVLQYASEKIISF